MAQNDAKDVAPQDEAIKQLTRIANLLALLAVKGDAQTDKFVTLAAAGFSPSEVGTLLGTTANAVSVALYAHRSKSKAKKTTKKKK